MLENAKGFENAEIARKALEEHRQIAESRQRLRELVDEWVDQPSLLKRREIHREFSGFRQHLLEHMDFEEQGGFMAPLLEVRPGMWLKVEQLQKEHDQLRRQIDDSLIALDPASEFTHTDMDIVFKVIEVLNFIEVHERVENGLVLEAFFQDTGTKD